MQVNLLEDVVAELERRRGELPAIAKASGLTYDTVLRIKNRENDPGYSKVQKLYCSLFAAGIPGHRAGVEA